MSCSNSDHLIATKSRPFAGLELKGAVIMQDNSSNEAIYGQQISAREIIVDGKVRTPSDISVFPLTLRKFSPKGVVR
jgi:lipid-binding SYLF domain-containing protein